MLKATEVAVPYCEHQSVATAIDRRITAGRKENEGASETNTHYSSFHNKCFVSLHYIFVVIFFVPYCIFLVIY